MQNRIALVADSTCDLSPELIARYGVTILPLNIILGGASYRDGLEITPDEIYAWADAHAATPKTAAPGMEDAVRILRPLAESGRSVLCFGISESMSSSCQVMRLAAAEAGCRDVHVIDSENLSTGIGLQILRAAELAEAGLSAGEIAEKIEADRGKVRASFVVNTLTYLHRGGRCSAVAALLGNALHLKPKIAVTEGKMGVAKKYRGAQEKVISDYVDDLLPALAVAAPEHVFITHSGVEDALVDTLRAKLESLRHFEEIHVTRAGGVITSHCGPGCLGVLYYEK
jgi:DegV family protein with EDD domain